MRPTCYTGSVPQKSPWLALALGVLGLTVGYTAVVLSGETALASGAHSCPFKDKGVTCTGADCRKNEACKNGECGPDCPGCQHHG